MVNPIEKILNTIDNFPLRTDYLTILLDLKQEKGLNPNATPFPRKLKLPSFQTGVYTSPQKYDLAGTPAYVVDPHNEVLPFWAQAIGDDPAVLLHIDDHRDMGSAVSVMHPGDSFLTYAQRRLNIANFIAAAVHYTGLKTVYWFNPRENRIHVWRNLRTRISKEDPFPTKEYIYWDNTAPEIGYHHSQISLSLEEGIKELGQTGVKRISDLDLDAFCCISDQDQSIPAERNRINRAISLLREIPPPDLITIARSQTPSAYTPPDRVDEIQYTVLRRLAEIYRKPE